NSPVSPHGGGGGAAVNDKAVAMDLRVGDTCRAGLGVVLPGNDGPSLRGLGRRNATQGLSRQQSKGTGGARQNLAPGSLRRSAPALARVGHDAPFNVIGSSSLGPPCEGRQDATGHVSRPVRNLRGARMPI